MLNGSTRTNGQWLIGILQSTIEALEKEIADNMPRWHQMLARWRESSPTNSTAPYYSVRSRMRANMTSIVWEERVFQGKVKGRRVIRTRSLSIGKNRWTYRPRDFLRASPGQLEVIEAIELEAGRIRFEMEQASMCLMVALRREGMRKKLPTTKADL